MAVVGIESIQSDRGSSSNPPQATAGAARGLVTASLASAVLWLSILIVAIALL